MPLSKVKQAAYMRNYRTERKCLGITHKKVIPNKQSKPLDPPPRYDDAYHAFVERHEQPCVDYMDAAVRKCHENHDDIYETCLYELFEAGADAMLEGLLKIDGFQCYIHDNPGTTILIPKPPMLPNGYLVFIPGEEEADANTAD